AGGLDGADVGAAGGLDGADVGAAGGLDGADVGAAGGLDGADVGRSLVRRRAFVPGGWPFPLSRRATVLGGRSYRLGCA
ncbi:hypothetical protein AB0B42_26810, partial [Streptomyces fradiae]|uniref:hypothetical protein n=1 Tax=Streptomyces fradiae TaxID=1906 RepID=UPI0033F66E1A